MSVVLPTCDDSPPRKCIRMEVPASPGVLSGTFVDSPHAPTVIVSDNEYDDDVNVGVNVNPNHVAAASTVVPTVTAALDAPLAAGASAAAAETKVFTSEWWAATF